MSLYGKLKNILASDREVTVQEPVWYPGVAIITGLLAAVAGVVAVRTAYLSNEAVYYSNIANLSQARCSDAWAEYQADSIKARIVETALLTSNPSTVNKASLQSKADEYRANQKPLKDKAINFEKDRDEKIKMSNKKLSRRDSLNVAGLVVQLAIGLASIAAMTKKTNAFVASVAVTVIALIILGVAFIMP
jgi:VIT1/CCC1 family predicted Fe2+/Mn2+ transporter